MTKEQFLQRKVEKLSTPDGDVFIRTLTVGEILAYLEMATGKGGYAVMASAAVVGLCDEQGNPLFPPDFDVLQIPFRLQTLKAISSKVNDLCGLSEKAGEDAEKN